MKNSEFKIGDQVMWKGFGGQLNIRGTIVGFKQDPPRAIVQYEIQYEYENDANSFSPPLGPNLIKL